MYRLPRSYQNGRDFVTPAKLCDHGDFGPDDLPDLSKPSTQGCFIELIARSNHRRSKVDALRSVAHARTLGLSMPEALVHVLELDFESDVGGQR